MLSSAKSNPPTFASLTLILAPRNPANKKTYITAVTGIVGAVGAYLVGEMTLVEAFQVIWPLVTVAFCRQRSRPAKTGCGL